MPLWDAEHVPVETGKLSGVASVIGLSRSASRQGQAFLDLAKVFKVVFTSAGKERTGEASDEFSDIDLLPRGSRGFTLFPPLAATDPSQLRVQKRT